MYNLITSVKIPVSSQKSEIPRLKTKASVQCKTDVAKIISSTKQHQSAEPSSANNLVAFVSSMLRSMLDANINVSSNVETLRHAAKCIESQAQDSSFRTSTKHLFEMLSMFRKMDLDVSLHESGESSEAIARDTRALLDLLFGGLMSLFVPRLLSKQLPSSPLESGNSSSSANSVDVSLSNAAFYQAFSGWSYVCIITEKCSLKLSASPSSSEILLSLSPRAYNEKELNELLEKLPVSPAGTPTPSSELDIPESFCDPISAEIMEDPVVTYDGHTYERTQIEKWFQFHDTSPLTGLKLANKILIPNFLVRSQIKEFKERNVAHFKQPHT